MKYKTQLETLIKKNKGLLLTKDVTATGIPRVYINDFIEHGVLEKLERGVYITKDSMDDTMYRLQAKYPPAIFSHDTALFLHDMTDRDPLHYAVTVPAGYNAKNIKDSGAKVYSIKKELYKLGLCTSKTPFGREIKTYNPERTICDILRSRNQIDIAILTDALKRYTKRKDKDLPLLMRYAESFRVVKILRSYLEVLL
jgi:predicted transcriptional regulator of viral defense system